jgi:hypothetical protein
MRVGGVSPRILAGVFFLSWLLKPISGHWLRKSTCTGYMAHPFKKRAFRIGERSSSLLANTGGSM